MKCRRIAAKHLCLWRCSRASFKTTSSQWPSPLGASTAAKPLPSYPSRGPPVASGPEAKDADPRRLPVRLISTAEQCRALVDRLLDSSQHSIAVDCEGVQLGRFGKLSVMQIATNSEVFLVDVEIGGSGLVKALIPLFAHRDLVKVFHDCREDASLLLNRYGAPLHAVYDTQVGFAAWLERRGLDTYQAGLAEVLRTFKMDAYRLHRWDKLERNAIAPARWHERPLPPQAVRYAVEGVAHLLPLKRMIDSDLGDPGGTLVLHRSAAYVDYATMNRSELPSEGPLAIRLGAPLQVMLASKRSDAAFFKLNHAPLTGVVLDQLELRDFADLKPGDLARCRVKSISDCKQFVHLLREGHGQLLFDRQRGEMRKLPLQDEVDQRHPGRQSSLYGLGAGLQDGPAVKEEPRSFKERQPEVIHKIGKRGSVKVKKSGFQPPAQQQQSEHRSFPFG